MALDLYKKFIDDLVEQCDCIYARRVREKLLWPNTAAADLVRQNKVIESLNEENRKIVSEILQNARNSGMHDVLVYLSEQMELSGLRIVIDGIELPVEPFDTSMFYDWIARCNNDTWPDEK